MRTLICGSIAYDNIMVFEGRFREHILPEQIHILNVAFLVPELRREFGGCAGNIAYNLKLLGSDPLVMATVETIPCCISSASSGSASSLILCAKYPALSPHRRSSLPISTTIRSPPFIRGR